MKQSTVFVEDFVIESILDVDPNIGRTELRGNMNTIKVGDNINIFYKNKYILTIDWTKLT